LNVRNNDGNNALWFACFRDRQDVIEQLISAGIDLDNQNDNGATVLMYAASAGKAEMVKALLAAGADAQLTNLDDFRAIDFAANFDIIRILKHGVGNRN
jgi:ankyrin repeat protein